MTLCRAPTLACLGRACGRAGTEIPVLWEGFGCTAAASLNMTFSCLIGGVEVPAVNLEELPSSSAAAEDGLEWAGGDDREEAWGPSWVGGAGGGLVCEVPRLEWVEAGQEETVMVPVEVLWSLPTEVSVARVAIVVVWGGGGGGMRSVWWKSWCVCMCVCSFVYYTVMVFSMMSPGTSGPPACNLCKMACGRKNRIALFLHTKPRSLPDTT